MKLWNVFRYDVVDGIASREGVPLMKPISDKPGCEYLAREGNELAKKEGAPYVFRVIEMPVHHCKGCGTLFPPRYEHHAECPVVDERWWHYLNDDGDCGADNADDPDYGVMG